MTIFRCHFPYIYFSHIRGWLLVIFFDLFIGCILHVRNLYHLITLNFLQAKTQFLAFSNYPFWDPFFSLSFFYHLFSLFLFLWLLYSFLRKSTVFPAAMIWFFSFQLLIILLKNDQMDAVFLEQIPFLSTEEIGKIKENFLQIAAADGIIMTLLTSISCFIFFQTKRIISRKLFFSFLLFFLLSVLSNHFIDWLSLHYLTDRYTIFLPLSRKRFLYRFFSFTFSQFILTKSVIWIPYFLISQKVKETFVMEGRE